MKTSFRGYYRPTDEEFKALWEGATFALDANVLLNIYGYSTRTRNTVLSLFKAMEQRLWVPYQFAKEYQKNRVKAIAEQANSYGTAIRDLRSMLDQRFRVTHKHPYVSKKSVKDLERICDELDKAKREYEKLYSADPYFSEITELLKERVGQEPSPEHFATLCEEARKRYAEKIPPGYEDRAKPEPDAFGDFLGWKEILAHGHAAQVPTVLVTDDEKEDWWRIHNKDRRLGPRPELEEEYWDACGQAFYMYSLAEFMRYAQIFLGQPVTPAAIQEVRDRSAAHADERQGEKASGVARMPLLEEEAKYSEQEYRHKDDGVKGGGPKALPPPAKTIPAGDQLQNPKAG